jgi:hypothetical protein
MSRKLSVLLGLGGGGVFAMAKGAADAATGIARLSRQAGMGVTLFQEYAHAAFQAELSNEELAKGIGRIRQTAIDAFKGDGQARSILRLAGINPKTAKGEIKSADTIFLELADKVQMLQAAGKDLKAEELLKGFFGNDGLKFLPMLKNGAQGLLEARQEAAKYGMFSDKDIEDAKKFNISLGKAWKGIKGFGYSLGAPLLEPLTRLVDKFTEWGLAQKDIISGDFSRWIESLDIDEIWKSIKSGIKTLADLGKSINALAKFFGGWGNVLAALAGIIAGKFIYAIAMLTMSFVKLGLAILTTPVGWFILACAAIGAAVYAIYKNWDSIVAYFKDLWQGVKDAFASSWTEGIIKMLWDFNPLRLILKGINEMIAYFTGFDFFENIGKKWVEQLTGWMPDKLKKYLGIGSGGDSASASAEPASAQPLNLAPAARSIAETRTEHVERQENRVTLVPPDGWAMQVSGPGAGVQQSGTSMQLGYQG